MPENEDLAQNLPETQPKPVTTQNSKKLLIAGVISLAVLFVFGLIVTGFAYTKYREYASSLAKQQELDVQDSLTESLAESEPVQLDTVDEAPNEQPQPTAQPSVSPTPPAPPAPPVQANCIQYKIREGEFESDNCYTPADYDDLLYYLSRYNSAVFSYNSAISSMKITCNGSEFFEEQCEEDEEQKDDAEDNIDEYEDKVKEIIARGT